jgi:hypothetical protein
MWAMVAALDTIDKRATRCIQRLELYAAVDYILAAGGFSFGWKGTVGIVLPSVFFFGGRDMFFFTILSAMLGQVTHSCDLCLPCQAQAPTPQSRD